MIPTNEKIVVRVNMQQKDFMEINGVKVKMAPLFEKNYREKSPVIGEIVEGNKYLPRGTYGVFHHNHFYHPSPYFLQDDLYSVPFNRTLFGIFDPDWHLKPICGNMLCERFEEETPIPLPIEHRKLYIDRAIIVNPGNDPYRIGQLVFHTPNAAYEIVYNVDGKERRIHKIHSEFIIGVE